MRLVWAPLLLLCSCSIVYTEVGRPVPATGTLEIGVSTKADALDQLGPPRVVRRQFDGELYTYRRVSGERRSLTILPIMVKVFFWSHGQTLEDDVTLLFDHEGVLRGVGRRMETEPPAEQPARPERTRPDA